MFEPLHVVSLYDFTGEALRPWAERGYQCFAYDIQHKQSPLSCVGQQLQPADMDNFEGGGNIFYIHADLHNPATLREIEQRHTGRTAFLSAFPVCTDMAVSGAKHFASKAKVNPDFQKSAAIYAVWCSLAADNIGCPYFVENPVSVLSTLWRKPDYTFHPYEFGGYLPADDSHPRYADYIAPWVAYSKKTCLWAGGGFTMPATKPVECQSFGASSQFAKLGGKSAKTKNIRSATPRGFALAVCLSNQPKSAVIAA
jgi:hypothetical protein